MLHTSRKFVTKQQVIRITGSKEFLIFYMLMQLMIAFSSRPTQKDLGPANASVIAKKESEKKLIAKGFDFFISYMNEREDAIRNAYKEKRDAIIRKILAKAVKKKNRLNLTMSTDEIRHSEYPYTDVSGDRWIYLDRIHVDMDDYKKMVEHERQCNEQLLNLEIFLLKKKIEYCKKYQLSLIASKRRRKNREKKWNIVSNNEGEIPSEKKLKKRLENLYKTLEDRKKEGYLHRFWKIDHRGYDIEEYLDILKISGFWDEKEWFENAKDWELHELYRAAMKIRKNGGFSNVEVILAVCGNLNFKRSEKSLRFPKRCSIKQIDKDKGGIYILAPVVDSRQDWKYSLQVIEVEKKNTTVLQRNKTKKYSEEYEKEIKENLKKYPCDATSHIIEQEGGFTGIVVENSTFVDVEKVSKKALNMRWKIKGYDFKNSLIKFDLSFENYDDAAKERQNF